MEGNSPDRRFVIFWIVCLASIVASREFLPSLLRDDLYDEDYAHHIWWTYRWIDPGLFPNDLAREFFSQPILAPYGYQWLFRLFVPIIDPQYLAEVLPFLLVLAGTVFAFLIGQRVGGGLLGGFIGATFFIMAELRFLHAGLPRSFATPILLFGMWALITQRQAALGGAFLLAVLFYPPSVANLGVCAAIILSLRIWQEKRLPDGWLGFVGLGCLALVVLGVAYLRPFPPELGDKVTFAEAYAMPEFWPGGRSQFFNADLWHFYFGKRNGLGINPWVALLLMGLLITTWRTLPGAIVQEAWTLAGVSIGLFISAHATLFVLHYPNRFTLYALPVFGLIVLAGLIPRLITRLCSYDLFGRVFSLLGKRSIFIPAGCLALLGFGVEATTKLISVLNAPPNKDLVATYAFLETLPKDTLVASHPNDADDIPLRSRRSVLASMETSLPLYVGYYRTMSERIGASLAAVHATDFANVDSLYDQYGVDVFVVNRCRFEPGQSLYFQPFYTATQEQWERGNREGFVLRDPPAERVLFQQGDFSVIRVGPLGQREGL